ncbi:MAG TPA: hypothetical protein VM219_03640 [Phycisphaerae bacterium]|nr:hypothetical protein [Phycisphaerae bacterium]
MPTPRITFHVSSEQLDELERNLAAIPKDIPRVLAGAINRAVRAMEKATEKAASRDPLLPKLAIVKDRVWRSKARPARSGRKERMVGRVYAGKIGWPLSDLSPKQGRRGVSVGLGGRRTTVQHAFIVGKLGSGVFMRGARQPDGSVVYTPRSPRLPIHKPRTRDVTTAVETSGAAAGIVAQGKVLMDEYVRAEMNKLLGREERR